VVEGCRTEHLDELGGEGFVFETGDRAVMSRWRRVRHRGLHMENPDVIETTPATSHQRYTMNASGTSY